jgi:hypothetical protein
MRYSRTPAYQTFIVKWTMTTEVMAAEGQVIGKLSVDDHHKFWENVIRGNIDLWKKEK